MKRLISPLFPSFLAGCVVVGVFGAAGARAETAVDFNRDVRPILSQNCFKCHGVDDKGRKAKLRLDVREDALKGGKSGEKGIAPGKPDESEVIKRLITKDEEEIMPPASTKKVLTEAEKDVLKRWVAQGAEYKPHWAFVAPKQAELPAVKQADWGKNPIDRFVLARLEKEGLKPSKEADRYTLIRRVSLDLTGLPPTPAEADAFAADKDPQAYDKLADRLLASPAYGERWARRWLDLARYADTNGYEKDRPRSIWPWREWVIKAFNADMPFDQFTIEQLAGDLLPNATLDQKIATGFHRNTMRNEEGGSDPLEYRFHSMVDRVGTTGTTWLGLTVACAQCHTHKYDPIRHTEYYQLFAFLNNCDEPEMDIPSAEMDAKKTEIDKKIVAVKAGLAGQWPVGGMKWAVAGGAEVKTAHDAKAESSADGSIRITGPAPETDTYTITFDAEANGVDRLRLEVLKDGKKGPGRTEHGNFVLSEISISVAPKDAPEKSTPVKIIKAEADFSQDKYNIADTLDGNPKTGWGIAQAKGNGVKEHAATFTFEKPIDLPKGGRWTVKLEQNFGQKHTLGRFRLALGKFEKSQGDVEAQRKHLIEKSFAAWEQKESAKAIKWQVLRPASLYSSTVTLTQLPDDSVLASGDITKSDTYDLTFKNPGLKNITAVRIEAIPHPSLPKNGPGMVFYEGPMGDFQLSDINLFAGGKEGKFTKALASFSAPNMGADKAIDDNKQTGWMINGGQGKAHHAVFGLDQPTGDASDLKISLLFEKYYASALGHFRIAVSTDPKAADAISPVSPEVEALLLIPAESRTADQKERIFREFLMLTPELADARKEIAKLESSLPKPPTTLVMVERPEGHQRSTHVHNRGEFLQITDPVEPNVPAFLPPLPKDAPPTRLTLAKWLVSPENPLTARVTVNRQWAAFFGRGIVRTTEDFGFQGELPSHPELLDWMAVQFMKDGWSFKKLDKLIVTSATYRQSSQVSSDLLAKDPQNVLLSRGPRFRLEAEIVRDSMLKSAGLLSEKIGGPSVFPPQVASVTTEGAYGPFQWNASTGEDRFRRSLYTFAKRTAPFALYNCFDAPTGEACVARREMSNTPLQALSLLNDQVFLEAAQAMGKNAADLKGDDTAKAEYLMRQCLIRIPEKDERAMIIEFARTQRERFEKKELDAAKIAGTKDGNVVEKATWTAVARAVMNLDEAVTKD